MDSIGVKNKIPANRLAVDGVGHRRFQEDQRAGFFWRTVAGFNQRGRFLFGQRQEQVPSRSLKKRRVFVLPDTVRVFLLGPLRRRYNTCLVCQRRFSLPRKPVLTVPAPSQTWLVAKGQRLPWQSGVGALIGGKVIIAERHSVFCQLLFDYYAAAHSEGEAYRGSPWSETHGDCTGPYQPHKTWQPDNNCQLFHSNHLFSSTPEPCLVLFSKSRFGFWHIKVLAALLLLFILVAGLDALTGIQGYISVHMVSATGLLSGLIVGLAVIALVLLVMCMLRQ